MLIAMDYNLVDVQHRLGHRKPDTTLRIYTHQWHYRDARRSRIGHQLDPLFHTRFKQLQRGPLALPPAAAAE
jgi:integrase